MSAKSDGTTGNERNNPEEMVCNALILVFNGRATLGELEDLLEEYSLIELHSACQHSNQLRLFRNKTKRDSVVIVYDREAKLCVHYSTRGVCYKNNCQFFHLCRDMLEDQSCNKRNCSFSHDIADEHNKSIVPSVVSLKKYNCQERLTFLRSSNPKVCEEYNSPTGCKNNQLGSCPDIHICSDKLLRKCNEGPERCKSNHDIFQCCETLGMYFSMNNSMEFLEKVIIIPQNLRMNKNPPKEMKKLDHNHNKVKPVINENEVFEYIVKKRNGTTTILDVSLHCTMFSGLSIDRLLDWFKASRKFLVFQHTWLLEVSRVVAFSNALKLCFARECRKDVCHFLHVCRRWLSGDCDAKNCKFNHDLRDEHNGRILTSAGFVSDLYSKENDLDIVRCSMLKCCTEHNNKDGVCINHVTGTCPHLHVCSQFIQAQCKSSDANCKFGHNLALDKCMKTLAHYRMDRLPQHIIWRNLIVKQNPASVTSMYSEHTFICEANLRNKCSKGLRCKYHHFEYPYLWQVKIGDCWKDLLADNYEVEKAYSNVYMPSCILAGKEFFRVVLDFDTFQMKLAGQENPVRRLSTKSYICDRNEGLFSTCWLWYWIDDFGIWNKYSEDGTPPYQDVIEGCFQQGLEQYDFEHGDQKYILNLEERKFMQTNVVYGTQRPVRRRPQMVEKNDIQRKIAPKVTQWFYDQDDLPDQWIPMDTRTPEVYEKIEIQSSRLTFRLIKSEFHKTMASCYEVRRIFKIQNLTHWRNYERKRETMAVLYNGNTSDLDEKQLFHGTEKDTVECICRQNFDPRMHGKNAVSFGKGVYFAKNAGYSNVFTGSSFARYMFYAKVLTGRKIPGDKSMQRPPPVDPRKPAGELHGCCVDDVNDPTIFVIFDRDQCYPDYLIEYHSKDK